MIKAKKMILYLSLALCASGCSTSSKAVRPTGLPESKVSVKEERLPQQQIGLRYTEITNLIDQFLNIQPIQTDTGEPKFLGVSEDKLVTLEIIGEKNNVLQASMKIDYPENIVAINADLNRAMMLRFLRNTAPEFGDWSNEVKEIVNKFYSMQIDTKEEENIALGKKIIKISYDKKVDSITVTVKADGN